MKAKTGLFSRGPLYAIKVIEDIVTIDNLCYNERMRYWCLSCNHEWGSRGVTPSRQCPSCWKWAIVDEDELQLAGIAALPLARISESTLPALPTPEVALKFPFAIASFVSVMNRAGKHMERRRAVELMLTYSGVEAAEASVLASRMYP